MNKLIPSYSRRRLPLLAGAFLLSAGFSLSSQAATIALVTGGGNRNNTNTIPAGTPVTGTVTFAGLTIANWEIIGTVAGFGADQDLRITTGTGNTIGVDVQAQGAGSGGNDSWDFTLNVTPIAGTPYDITGVRVLGQNPDNPRNYGPPALVDIADVLTFTGTNVGSGTVSNPNGNLNVADGASISAAGGTASWLPGNLFTGDWSHPSTDWQVSFPEITPGLDTTPISIQFQTDFLSDTFSEGFAFQILVPEPSRALLISVGLGLCILRRRR